MISQMSPRSIYRWPDATAAAEAQLERKADAPLIRARAEEEGTGAARARRALLMEMLPHTIHPGPEKGPSIYDI